MSYKAIEVQSALTNLTPDHINTFLTSCQLTLDSVTELAEEWHEMEEYEKFHFRQDFTRAFGLRKELGQLYQSHLLDDTKTIQLAELDRMSLALAANLETVYGLGLRQLFQNLIHWGTPLMQQQSVLQINTTFPAMFDLVQN